jgi:hypothetical protein
MRASRGASAQRSEVPAVDAHSRRMQTQDRPHTLEPVPGAKHAQIPHRRQPRRFRLPTWFGFGSASGSSPLGNASTLASAEVTFVEAPPDFCVAELDSAGRTERPEPVFELFAQPHAPRDLRRSVCGVALVHRGASVLRLRRPPQRAAATPAQRPAGRQPVDNRSGERGHRQWAARVLLALGPLCLPAQLGLVLADELQPRDVVRVLHGSSPLDRSPFPG